MKFDLSFSPPFMNAAGTLGFAPDPHGPVEPARLGAFITNPISHNRRTPTQGRRFAEYPGGFLLHSGHPNPGLNAVRLRYAAGWRRAPLPILAHLIPSRAEEAARMVRRLEGMAGLNGVEIGLPPGTDEGAAVEMARAVAGELPVVMRLPLETAVQLARAIAADRSGAAVSAFSLGPPRGALPVDAAGGRETLHGRLYGPAIFPPALAAVQTLAGEGLAVIGAGGVYSPAQARAMLEAGALAVQLDAVLWRGGFEWEDLP